MRVEDEEELSAEGNGFLKVNKKGVGDIFHDRSNESWLPG